MSGTPLNAATPVEGVVHNLAFADYLARPGLSHSQMKRLHPTPAHFLAPEAPEEDAALTLGTLCHLFVLEPGATLPAVAIRPKDLSFQTKEGKAWRDAKQGEGFTIMTQDEHDAATAGARAVCRHPLANQLLRNGQSEVSYFRTVGTHHGPVVLKARVDFVPGGRDFLMDIKTAVDASPWAFANAVARLRYYGQAVHYIDMHNALNPDDRRNEMVFFVVEKKPPYLVACYTLDASFLAIGRKVVAEDIATYARCLSSRQYPGYEDGPVTLPVPNWLSFEEAA